MDKLLILWIALVWFTLTAGIAWLLERAESWFRRRKHRSSSPQPNQPSPAACRFGRALHGCCAPNQRFGQRRKRKRPQDCHPSERNDKTYQLQYTTEKGEKAR